MYSLVLLDEAKQEWFDAVLYYEAKVEGLGERFSVALENHLDLIAEAPKHYRRIKKEYRQILIKGFPFLIIYRIEERNKEVVITSVFHSKRHPTSKIKR